MPKPTRSVPQHIVLACIQHFSPHESLLQSCFIKAKMACFLEQSILLHICLFFHITENSNEGHPRVTAAVLSAIPYNSYVAIAIWSNAMPATKSDDVVLSLSGLLGGLNSRTRRTANNIKTKGWNWQNQTNKQKTTLDLMYLSVCCCWNIPRP